MYRLKIALSMIMMTFGTIMMAQNKNALLEAIGNGNVETIGTYIDGSVEICILDDQNLYEKQEGLSVLKSFFDQHPSKGFSKKHAGDNNKSSSTYTIGKLTTDGGSFRVFVYTDQTDDGLVLEELRISRQ